MLLESFDERDWWEQLFPDNPDWRSAKSPFAQEGRETGTYVVESTLVRPGMSGVQHD